MEIKYDINNNRYIIAGEQYDEEKLIGYIKSGLLRESLKKNTAQIIGDLTEHSYTEEKEIKNSDYVFDGKNYLYYGAPGTGKSWLVNSLFSKNSIRTVFHSDYSYYDFVGTYKPYSKGTGDIGYEFRPGPFVTALIEAYNHPTEMHNLIVEEINRGDASAAFGEILQLLDRKDDGRSEFPINPDIDMWDFFIKEIKTTTEELDYILQQEKKLVIPGNLNIVATMNTSDQAVNILDTAFKRRWMLIYVPIDYNIESNLAIEYGGYKVRWNHFIKTLNSIILDNDLPEDRQIGQYFLKEYEISDKQVVASKLLHYLWSDVFKYNRETIFQKDINGFEELSKMYSDDRTVFNDEISLILREG